MSTLMDDLPLPVEADAKRLRHVVGDLLNNAIQYTDPGSTFTITLPVAL